MITLRPHQIDAANAVESAFGNGVNRVLIDMCVAAGKSYTYAELARRAWLRGERTIIAAHRSELVEQNANACRMLGLQVGVNSSTLDERVWRAPVISCQIQSTFKNGMSFGPVGLFCGDEAHLWPHSEAGMFHELHRGLGRPRLVGGSGTPFRLQGGSLTEGEGAPFDRTVYRYTIMDGIRDGYLVPPYSASVDDKIDPNKLKVRQGEYTGASSDDQMIAAMDNHIVQMRHYGLNRRSWLVFEASTKAAVAMCERMNAWGIPTGLVLGSKSKADDIARRRATEQLRSGQFRALVNLDCLTTGFDVQEIDMLVCRRRTKSLSLWIQIIGRLLRTIGGNIATSTAAGKSDGLLLDFAGNTDEFGPLDFIRPKQTKLKFVCCDSCNARNPSAAGRCWSCDEVMLKNCPLCLTSIPKSEMQCSACGHDMRAGPAAERKQQKLFDVPTGAALISNYKNPAAERAGGWLAIRQSWRDSDVTIAATNSGDRVIIPDRIAEHAPEARWLRHEIGIATAILCPNGASRSSARQISADGSQIMVPMPAQND